MRLFNLLLLATSATALALLPTPTATPTPTLIPRDTSTTLSSTPSPTEINFFTTILNVIPGKTEPHVTLAPITNTLVLPTCIHTITPDKNGYVPPGTCGALYDYYPSFAAAVVFSILFGVLSLVHIILAAKFQTKFAWVLIMGSLWETFSFTARSISTRFQQSAGVELVASLFVLLAPLWINAFAYMVLGRLLYFFHPNRRIWSLPASALAFAFVALDFVSFIVQLVGGSYAGPTAPQDQQMKGVHIYMGGIGLQQFFIFIFAGLAIKFYLDMKAFGRNGTFGAVRGQWVKLWAVMLASLGFITIRIFFRLVQFSAGREAATNNLISHESYFYILEAVPMLLAISCFIAVHPGTVLPKGESMPGLFAKAKGWCCCGKRPKGMRREEDGIKLVGSYAEIRGEGSPPPYSSRRGEGKH